ncbi:uncharacterized protein LOC120331275 [Styela clava]
MSEETGKWLDLEGIPGPSSKKQKPNTPESNIGPEHEIETAQHEDGSKTKALLPDLVVREASIIKNDVRPSQKITDQKANKDSRFMKENRTAVKNFGQTPSERYQEVMQDILRQKMRDSWLNTSYQRAIWNARRRLLQGDLLEDLPTEEKHIVSSLISPQMKPDYSKWKYPKTKHPYGLRLPQLQNSAANSADLTPLSATNDLSQGFLPEHFVQAFHAEEELKKIESSGLQVYPIEFVSLSDRLTLHEPPWLAALRFGRESGSYDNFGLCYGCFHKKGPHYHYNAPIRIGGGYSIYRRHPLQPLDIVPANIKVDTGRWIVHGDEQSGSTMFDQEIRDATMGDDFSTRLFHGFLDNGGDPDALKEYLESNFDPEVLKDLQMLGINVQLIKEYAELLRGHIKEKMTLKLEKQSGIVKANDREIELVKRFIEIISAGGDLDMLLCLLRFGRNSDDILKFEKQGGNVELLEHYASRLLRDFAGIQDAKFDAESDDDLTTEQKQMKTEIIESLRLYIENEIDHKHANILLEYISRGGKLDVLLEYIDKGASSAGVLQYEAENGDISLVQEYAEKFPNKTMLIRDIEKFVKNHFRSYATANLLQKYIENGGKVKILKQYVNDGCSFSSERVQKYVKEGGNVRLLQDIGEKFANDRTIREDLEQFPDDPKIVEAYIRRGGNFPKLVRAIADATDDPLIEDYVKRKADAAINVLKITSHKSKKARIKRNMATRYSKSANGLLQTNFYPRPKSADDKDRSTRSVSPGDLHALMESPNTLAHSLLPRLLETARAELKYDKLMATDEILKQNEGAFLAKTVEINQEMLPVTSVYMGNIGRQIPFSIYHSSDSKVSSTVSLLTGKQRPRLWKAPAPFTIRKSDVSPTQPQLPFSENRQYDISSLSEDRILEIERKQRHELDVLRRNYNSKDFHDNWRVAVRSPAGSVISEHDSTTMGEFEETKPVSLQTGQDFEPAIKKKDKASRREQQRRKMKKLKQGKNRAGSRKERSLSPAPRRSSSSSSLTLPDSPKLDANVAMPSKELMRANDDIFSPTVGLSREGTKASSRSRSSSEESGKRGKRDKPETKSILTKERKSTADLTIGISSISLPDSQSTSSDKSILSEMERKSPESNDENTMRSHIVGKPPKHVLPPLPKLPDINDDDEPPSPIYQSAFGKPTPRSSRSKIPILPEMIDNPETQMSEEQNKLKKEDAERMLENMKNKGKMKTRPLTRGKSNAEMLLDAETPGSAVDDVLKKFCIIREESLPRYRHIFDKHLMLKEMRLRERAMKAKRANNELFNEDSFEDVTLEESYREGPAHVELKKLMFLAELLADKIDTTEHEIVVAKGCLDRAKALTAREILFKTQPSLATPRRRKTPKTRPTSTSVFGRNAVLDEDFQNEKEIMENAETAMSITQQKYDYDQSARIGYESRSGTPRQKMQQPTLHLPEIRAPQSGTLEIPLEELNDAQVLNKLSTKHRKEIGIDPVVKHNTAAFLALQDKLKRMKERQKKLLERLEKQKLEAERERGNEKHEKSKKETFIRQQSVVYQALHPADDPVLSIDDVPEALRDVNGEISRADSAVIFEALDFPRHSEEVNFRVFCILAALSESAVSIQPLVKRLVKTRDARALNVKMDKCKEIYGFLLGTSLDNLQSELRSSSFSSAQYHQVLKKLTRDEGKLSFLDFVTYVPLFLDIHQKIVASPLRG